MGLINKIEAWFDTKPVLSSIIEFMFLIAMAGFGWLFLVIFS